MIYVETRVRAPFALLWQCTQDPGQHTRWDLRFTAIEPLLRTGEQRFRYAFRPLPGCALTGVGVATAQRRLADGTAVSGLRFRADQRWSPLREGSGYWKYVPDGDGTRFLTGYRYRGPAWSRPILGWATAWSFDRLRLWLETGRSPRRLLWRAWTEAVARAGLTLLVGWLATLARSPTTGLAVGLATAAVVLLVPPTRGTPAARRCRRHPPRPEPAGAAEELVAGLPEPVMPRLGVGMAAVAKSPASVGLTATAKSPASVEMSADATPPVPAGTDTAIAAVSSESAETVTDAVVPSRKPAVAARRDPAVTDCRAGIEGGRWPQSRHCGAPDGKGPG